jgi:transposase InsO family protein
MNVDDRRKYLKRMQSRYLASDRGRKGELLIEMEAVTGLQRKSLLRLLNSPSLERKRREVQRGRVYGQDVSQVINVVWESLDYVCAPRLTPCLLETARHLECFGELSLGEETATLLAKISRPTVQRLLTRLSKDRYRLPRRGPERANHLAREIPMGRIPFDIAEPGHFEVDLVHHSGPSTQGEYVHSLQMVDVALGWSERVAVLGRGQRAMEAGFRRIMARLPYPIKELHPDNGSEFLNDHLVRFFGEKITGLKLSRSRPWRKNDNRMVEQKNDTLVRAYFGNERLDTLEQCAAMNEVYEQMWLYYNLFQPVLHLEAKEVIGQSDGKTKVKRKWDEAKTPYQRLLAAGGLERGGAERLACLYAETNPRRLREQIHQGRDELFEPSKPCAAAMVGG